MSQLTVKECILISAPKSCELDPIPSKLLMESLFSLSIYSTLLLHLVSSHNASNQLLSHIFSNRGVLITMIQTTFRLSNLCFIANILENLVLSQISSYLNSHNLCNTCQSAYCPGHSTETALLKVFNDLFLSLIKGNISALALLDFSSAFDTIDHSIHVHCPNTDFGFTDAVLQWFSSYLTDRTHYVSLYNHY